MADKCPLCSGPIAENTCKICGYSLPRDKELTALYNLDPADYPQESSVREIIPEHISEEIYPNRADPAKSPAALKVREETAVQPMQNKISVQMNFNMPYANPMSAQNLQNSQNARYYVRSTQDIRSLPELLWDCFENFKENLWKCWTLLPLCYFFPPCILIYFVVAGVRLFSGEKVSIPFGLLTALVTVLGWTGGLSYLL